MKHINKALENSMVQAQYWNDWEELLRQFGYRMSENRMHDENNQLRNALGILHSYCRDRQLDAWRQTLMFGIVQPNEITRKKIAKLTMDEFLIDPAEHEHSSISLGNYLDPDNLAFAHMDEKIEEEFRNEIREHFGLKDAAAAENE